MEHDLVLLSIFDHDVYMCRACGALFDFDVAQTQTSNSKHLSPEELLDLIAECVANNLRYQRNQFNDSINAAIDRVFTNNMLNKVVLQESSPELTVELEGSITIQKHPTRNAYMIKYGPYYAVNKVTLKDDFIPVLMCQDDAWAERHLFTAKDAVDFFEENRKQIVDNLSTENH